MPNPNFPTRAYVMVSGGTDSTSCLFMASKAYDEIVGVTFDYGQKHSKESDFADRQCDEVNALRLKIHLGDMLSSQSVMLTKASNLEVPDISYDEIEGISPTYVPFRNGVFLSVTAAYAQKWVLECIEAEKSRERAKAINGQLTDDWGHDEISASFKDQCAVYFGGHAEDAMNWAYPDCTPEFVGSMANAIYTGSYNTVRVQAPILMSTKGEAIAKADKLGVNWADTWSCYKGEENHCGICPTCRARKAAFVEAGVCDPTAYNG